MAPQVGRIHTLHGVIDTFRTYASLYEFFDRASPAQLRLNSADGAPVTVAK